MDALFEDEKFSPLSMAIVNLFDSSHHHELLFGLTEGRLKSIASSGRFVLRP
jgi:hypothetical protein